MNDIEAARERAIRAVYLARLKEDGLKERELSEEEKTFIELTKAYKERFGESIGLPEPGHLGYSDMIPIIRECLKTGKPYEWPELPDDCTS